MERIVKCANKFKTKKIIEILGDNPLIDEKLIDDVINLSDTQKFDYVANISKDYKKEIQISNTNFSYWLKSSNI